MGLGHLAYNLGADINSFVKKNVQFSGKPEPPLSNTLLRSIADAKVKVNTYLTYLYNTELKFYSW